MNICDIFSEMKVRCAVGLERYCERKVHVVKQQNDAAIGLVAGFLGELLFICDDRSYSFEKCKFYTRRNRNIY